MSNTIVSVDELKAHLDDPQWVVVDCRHALLDHALGRHLYEGAHIPGAFFADTEIDLAGTKSGTNGRHPLPDAQRFVAFLRSLGVNDDTQIVTYDGGGDMFAARLWFLCRWIGHDRVAVLDGGVAAWEAAGYATTADVSAARSKGSQSVHIREGLVVTRTEVRECHPKDFTVLDARAADRFAGENETVDPVAGHIPGARNRPFKTNFDAAGKFKGAAILREEFASLDLPAEKIVHQCGSGVSAAVNELAMEIADLPGSRIYAGSWSEWIADPTSPIATGSTS